MSEKERGEGTGDGGRERPMTARLLRHPHGRAELTDEHSSLG